jgi:hypothetical protein
MRNGSVEGLITKVLVKCKVVNRRKVKEEDCARVDCPDQ